MKPWLISRAQLLRITYLKFFGIRELVYIEFTYEYFKNHSVKRDTHTRLAWVSRSTPLERVNALFNHKIEGATLKLTGARIIPVSNIPRA
jgi:hypothetical protein